MKIDIDWRENIQKIGSRESVVSLITVATHHLFDSITK